MMFSVKHITIEPTCEMEHTLFTSHAIVDCWSFVRNHLTCEQTQKKAKHYVVTDSIGRFYDPTIDVVYLKRAI